MTLLLDILYLLTGILLSPYILFRLATSERWRAGFVQRMGFIPRRTGVRPCLWVHAVSVGEMNAVKPLLDLIAEEHPEWEVFISATTNTGRKVAADRYGKDHVIYFPLDLSIFVRRAFRRLRPDILVLVELELWPNMLREARRNHAPIVIVNGRMREASVLPYRLLQPVLRPGLSDRLNCFCVQNEVYRDRFIRAGFPREKIQVTGNMKYDAVRGEADPIHIEELRADLGLAETERVWVAGCTWPGEEAICLAVHRELQKIEPGLRLAIAPRHIERVGDVAKEIAAAGYECRRRSAGTGPAGPGCVALLDTMGELSYLYALAESAFVGKSLTSRGGHNMLEPAALGVPVIFGPHTDNFAEEAELLVEAGAAVRVPDQAGLLKAMRELVTDAPLRLRRARAGREAVISRKGATRRHFEVLQSLMSEAFASGERGS